MSDEARERIHVDASPQRCYEVAIDFDRYPEWATDVKEVEILDRDEHGRGTLVRYRISALGKTIGYTLDYDYRDAPAGFSWTLKKADYLTRLDGSYRFDPEGPGTRLDYALTVNVTFPLPGFMKRAAAGIIVDNAVKQFKGYAEADGG